jgi:hypothetical protein
VRPLASAASADRRCHTRERSSAPPRRNMGTVS